ncbi:hypothetical protein BH11MYX1_BH11MYX1_47140 [soil metagenome]
MSDVTALLAEAAWLTRLARSLVGNDDADDIVQETYAAALRTPLDPDRPARPWLRRVMVNVVRMRHRGRVRRDTREQAIVAEATRTPEQLLERARVERTLADLVIALAEPLRSTVLLRYREGLSAEAIAKQQEVSVATVRRRLSDAVGYLRVGMDERETSKTWRAAFAPFLVARPASPPLWSVIMAKAATKVAIIAIAGLLLFVVGRAALHRAHDVGSSHAPAVESHAAATSSLTAGKLARVFVQPGVVTQQLAGRVTLADRGFAGAQVRVTSSVTREIIAEATSGIDGRFALPGVPAAALMGSATAKDKTAMPVLIDMRSPGTRGTLVELRLVDCVHVRGIVSDGSGAPIAHAHVAPDIAQIPFADTDTLGRFDLCAHAGPQLLRFAAGGYHAVLAELHLSGNDVLDVTLLPEAIVAGTVVDGANHPIADAAITIDPRGLNTVRDAPVIARSEADGSFRLTGVAAGRSVLFAEARGLASRRVGVVLAAGETREGIVLRLEHAPQLAGKVIDAHGQPSIGASISLRVGSVLHEDLAITQADGSFVIDRAPKGTSSIVIPHFEVVAPREVTIAEKDVMIEITANALPTVTGIVTRGGSPAANAIVQCPSARGNGDPAPVTNAAGTFACPLVGEGPFSVYASDAAGNFGGVQSTWARGQTLSPLVLEMDQAGTICGTVSEASGAHLRGIKVKAENPAVDDFGEATSDDDGAYCIRSLRNDGTFEISAWSGGQNIPPLSALPRVTLVKGKATLAITLAAPDQAIEGTVVDDTGTPVPDASVRSTAAQYFTNQVDVAVSDANGHFAIQHLAPGSYRVLATARSGASRTVDAVGAGTRDLKITLDRAGSIEGTLVGFHAQPSILGIMTSSGHEPIEFEVEGDHFRATGLPPGPYSITAMTNGHEADNKSIVVKAGAIAALVLASRGNARVSGHVIDWTTQRPVASARCSSPFPRNGDDLGVFMPTPETERAVDASGAFHFDDVTAGEISIPCDAGATYGIRNGTVAPGTNAQLDVFVVTPKTGGGDIGAISWGTRAMATVLPNGAKAGLQVNDEITALDGRSVELLDSRTVHNAISTHAVGSTLSVTVRRGAMIIPLEITL